jgi:hypothetical protein
MSNHHRALLAVDSENVPDLGDEAGILSSGPQSALVPGQAVAVACSVLTNVAAARRGRCVAR